jgi:DNA-binding transcriptional LysR family regulator
MPGVLAAFKKENPGIELTLIDKPTVGILEAVRDRSADLGVGTFTADMTDMSSAVIARDELVLLRAGTHQSGKDISWKDLQNEQLITLSEGSGIRALVDKALQTSGVKVKPAFEVEHITTALALAVAGLGVTVLPSYAAMQSTLCVQRLREPDVRRDICVITLRENSSSPAAQAFIALLRGVSNSVIWSRRKATRA